MSEQMSSSKDKLNLIIKEEIACEECASDRFSISNGILPIEDREYKVLVAKCKDCEFFYVHNLAD